MPASKSRPKYLEDPKRTSIEGRDEPGKRDYRSAIGHLERYSFWDGSGKVLPLWPAQKSAIALGVYYLNSDYHLSNEDKVCEAALLKLPTGTGKSGIIAALTRCLPQVKKSLVLTPRKALTDQMIRDLERRFWGHIGFAVPDRGLWTADADAAGAAVETAFIKQLLPNKDSLRAILEQSEERVVLVGTLQALDAIRRSRDKHQRMVAQGAALSADEAEELDLQDRLLQYASTFNLVVVDEGHYEPAPSWSRSVRVLNRPTILLSATPFRNDYKFFRVRGRFVFNMPFEAAVHDKIIRSVEFIDPVKAGKSQPIRSKKRRDLDEDEDSEALDTLTNQTLSADDKNAIDRFVELLQSALPAVLKRAKAYTDTPKIIVRARSYEALGLLQARISKASKQDVILIHERVAKNGEDQRYNSVAQAQQDHPKARFWLHETKLLEGVDDPAIVAIAIFEPFGNARQLVQQIGRAIRSTDRRRRLRQVASIIVRPDLLGQVRGSWDRYLEFEDYCSSNVAHLVQSEAAMPERVLAHMPELQYVAGDFRHKYLKTGQVHADDLQVPLRASVFLLEPSFKAWEAETEIEEAILAEDRFRPQRILGLPSNAFGRVYYGWQNSPYLRHHYLSEWTLGICVAVAAGRLLLVQDTGGIVFQAEEIDARVADRSTLLRALPEASGPRVVLTRMAAHSLDMSDRAIRTQSTRTRSFADTFTDLLDPSLVVTSAYGFIAGNGRYLGLARGRISDASENYVPLPEFCAWLEQLASELESTTRVPNSVFDRFAQPVTVSAPVAAKPMSILLDLATDSFAEFNVVGAPDGGGALGHDLPYEDLCADIENDEFMIVRHNGERVPCTIKYRPETKSYRIESERLNELHPPMIRPRSRRVKTLTQHINREQAFRVLVGQEGVVYMRRGFYQTRDLVSPGGIVLPLEDSFAVPALRETTSEKGESFFTEARWSTESIFGLVKRICDGSPTKAHGELGKALKEFEIVLLDDGGDELGDFFAIGDRCVAIIHAKADSKLHDESVTALQAVGRQVTASLAFCSTQARVNGIATDRWDRPYTANTTSLPLSRYFKNSRSLASREINARVKAALLNPSWTKEVWIVAGRLVNIDHVRDKARAGDFTNRRRQLLMYIDSLKTACARANARLRMFGHGTPN
jgi:superfamily II DNA or RNA helicase